MSKKRAVIQTIKDGRVEIYGRYFYPDDKYMEYDGRLDGMRYAFGVYYTGEKMDDKVSIIRVESAPIKFDPDDPASYSENQPEIVDGYIPWLFWFVRD
jgi:hypothetical protein